MINAEMKLRASLYRTESRGNHYREDYPDTNDKDWLAWVVIEQVLMVKWNYQRLW
jgi:succinate dehydrogenase/fumarate reductase flavoprotein subunit